MKSHIFIVSIAVLTYIYESKAVQHGKNQLRHRDRGNKEELIQIIKRLNKENGSNEELVPENDLEETLVRGRDVDRNGRSEEPRVHYIANPAVLADYIKMLNNKSDYPDLSPKPKTPMYVSRRNARYRVVNRPNDTKNNLNTERNGENDNLFTRLVTPLLQDRETLFKHYDDGKEKERIHKSEEYNIEAKKRVKVYSKNEWDNKSNENTNGRDKIHKDWDNKDKKNVWDDPNKNIDWKNPNKGDDWGISDKRDWNDPEYKKKEVDYNNPTAKNKKLFRNSYDTVDLDLDKKLEKSSNKPARKDDIVINLKKMEKENNDWSKITNSWNQNNDWDTVTNDWNQNKEINRDTKINTWKKNNDWKIIPTTREDVLDTKRTTRKTKLKNIDDWVQPLPHFENRYKHKIVDYYRPNRNKEYRNANFQSLGRTPIPFIGKKDIYADK